MLHRDIEVCQSQTSILRLFYSILGHFYVKVCQLQTSILGLFRSPKVCQLQAYILGLFYCYTRSLFTGTRGLFYLYTRNLSPVCQEYFTSILALF
jgi:hypothetical protein